MFKTIFENAGNGNIRAIIIEIEAETGHRSVLDIAEYDGFSEKVVEKLAKFLMKRHGITIEELNIFDVFEGVAFNLKQSKAKLFAEIFQHVKDKTNM